MRTTTPPAARNPLRCALGALAAACWLALPASALAEEEHVHEGDVLPMVEGGAIVIDDLDDKPVDGSTGYAIFEGDFGDLPGGDRKTDDPGYDHEAGQFTPGSLLGFTGVGPLLHWDGSVWGAAAAGISVTLTDALGTEVVFTGGSSSPGSGFIGQFDFEGNLHAHLDMEVNDGAPEGAYLFSLFLFNQAGVSDPTRPLADSTPISFILNYGLSFEAFEAGVEARVVPLPGAALLFAPALLLLPGRRRRLG